ncbi:hypothetical protein [Komagataeibacter sp. FNDCR2]|uniref:hypothetical protein n=1 Tax=Komagataeibacter sp. FNDCR2 TaxID=2878682 RepID=UPI001E64CE95|nr:hypothetical protein [Komagataeibacter sp. FNDCR2]MCE2576057.1 hypothetical protein [Komagataeibacter sp. FNDCR2]
MTRSVAWRDGYEWAYWPTQRIGESVSVFAALQSHGYEMTSEDARQFMAGANAALDEMEGRP